jgi:redox-sensing transcriptional repressor
MDGSRSQLEEAEPGESTYKGKNIPKAVIKRLSLYARALKLYSVSRIEKLSSQELGKALGINPAQVRKDLAYFGQFGIPGVGYHVEELRKQIKTILGTDRVVRIALVGVGNLGQALLSYGSFRQEGFVFVAAFDSDNRKVGTERSGVPIFHVDDLAEKLQELAVDIVVLAVPVPAAQPMADKIVEAGIHAIMNFVPCRLVVPPHVKVHYVDLTIEIESLSYYLR